MGEDPAEVYKGWEVYPSKKNGPAWEKSKLIFYTGDPINDWDEALAFIKALGGKPLCSSTCGYFVEDGWKYDWVWPEDHGKPRRLILDPNPSLSHKSWKTWVQEQMEEAEE